MHISPCVVNVMAAAAADFPGFPKPYTAANLETKPSVGYSSGIPKVPMSKLKSWMAVIRKSVSAGWITTLCGLWTMGTMAGPPSMSTLSKLITVPPWC